MGERLFTQLFSCAVETSSVRTLLGFQFSHETLDRKGPMQHPSRFLYFSLHLDTNVACWNYIQKVVSHLPQSFPGKREKLLRNEGFQFCCLQNTKNVLDEWLERHISLTQFLCIWEMLQDSRPKTFKFSQLLLPLLL